MTALEILEKARKKLSKRKAWTQNAAARGKSGKHVNPCGRAAVCWCLEGALEAAVGASWQYCENNGLDEAQDLLRGQLPKRADGLISFNDDSRTKHLDVLGLLDRTIARLEKKR